MGEPGVHGAGVEKKSLKRQGKKKRGVWGEGGKEPRVTGRGGEGKAKPCWTPVGGGEKILKRREPGTTLPGVERKV